MTTSAFGVDHGDVEKAFNMPKIPSFKPAAFKMPGSFAPKNLMKKPLGMVQQAGGAMAGAGAKMQAGARGPATTMGAGARPRMGAQARVGGAMNRMGSAMQRRPGAALGGAAGGGAVGATGMAMQRKKRPGQV